MKKMRKLTALLLALSLVLGCSVNAFAALPEEEEELEPQQLTPVYFGEPPYAGIDYNGEVYISPLTSVLLMEALGSLTIFGLNKVLPLDLPSKIKNALLRNLLSQILSSDIEDEYAATTLLWYRHFRYQSDRPDCVRILRKYYKNAECTHHTDDSTSLEDKCCDAYVGFAEYYILYV